jgi:hypothetical protein
MSTRACAGAIVGAVVVLGLLCVLASPGSAGGENALAGKILKMADLIEKGDAAGAKTQAKALAKDTELDDVMNLFKPRKKKGIGVGDKPGVANPDGIEQKLIALGRDAPSGTTLTKEAKALQKMGYVMAAVAEFATAKAPEKDMGKKKVKDWTMWATEMREGSVAFADAAKSNSPAEVHKAAVKLNGACNNCHSVFRD